MRRLLLTIPPALMFVVFMAQGWLGLAIIMSAASVIITISAIRNAFEESESEGIWLCSAIIVLYSLVMIPGTVAGSSPETGHVLLGAPYVASANCSSIMLQEECKDNQEDCESC